ncbi:MAG: phytoene desaturase family protein [Balneolales bacterium]
MNISIIGAGLGGLATSCLLAGKGYEITVFEKNDGPGGKMDQVINDGFRFDTGPSLLTMPEVLDEIFQKCGSRLSDYIKLIPLDPLCRYNFSDGAVFDSYHNQEKSLEAVRTIAPEDHQAYVDFLNYSSRLYDKTASSFLNNPLQRLSDLSGINLTDALRIDALKTVSDRIDQSFQSPYMRQFFKRFTTYNGSSPFKAPATLNVIPHIELNQGGFYVDGGMYKIAGALLELAQSRGVRFRFNAPVSEIKALKGKITGIVSEGEFIGSDLVVANSDASETYLNLINAESLKHSHRNKIEKLEPSCSGFVMLLGSDQKYSQLKHHNIFFSKDYQKEFTDIFDNLMMPADPTIYIANTSSTNPDHAMPGGSNLFVLINAPYLGHKINWSEHSEVYGRFIIKELEKRGLPGLQKSIRFQQIINPQDFYKRYRSNKGSIYGTSSNKKLSAFMRPGNKSPWFKNLYLTGGSTHPGGGIPLVMLSALHVNTLIERDKKR